MLGRINRASPQFISSKRRFVVRHIGMHRSNDRDVVHTLSDAGKNLADLDAALAEFFEFVRRRKRRAGFAFGFQVLHRHMVCRRIFQRRFWVEGIHLRGPAIGENMDDVFGFGRKLGLLGRERRNVPPSANPVLANVSTPPKSEARLRAPMPMPQRHRNSRRVKNASDN
jgi:hypothetical protein